MTTTTTAGAPVRARTYFGWQPEKVAFLFGMSAQRAAILTVAVLTAIWPLAVSRLPLVLGCWPIALVLAAAAVVRVAGRTSDEWLAAGSSYLMLRWRGQHKYLGAAFTPTDTPALIETGPDDTLTITQDPTSPVRDGGRLPGQRGQRGPRRRRRRAPVLDLPGILAPVRILAAPLPGGLPGTGAFAVAASTAPTPPSRRSPSPASGWSTPPAGTPASPGGAPCWRACAPTPTRSPGSRS